MGRSLKILYVSGEESRRQLKLRAMRLGVNSENLFVLAETDVERVIENIRVMKPDIVMIDSIQTMCLSDLSSSPGSIVQVRECTGAIMRCIKALEIPTILVGHVNKDGAIAGPKVLEHVVDAVLYLEGDRHLSYRILRAVKNRYGSTNEIGVFDMQDNGLREVSIIEGARECFPDIKINCKTSVYGVEFSSDTEMLDLNAIDITDLSDLDLTISLFPNLKSVEICSCRLDNEVIAALNDKYPDTKVVWLLKIERYSIRTDVQVFSTLSPTAKKLIFDKTALPIFKYCTDLRALDIGHNGISDLRPLTNLKKLHTLILADNYLTDISPLTELNELNYVEFQVNQIKDISPLSELPLMSDVKIDRNDGLKNITSLTKCKNLKKLFCSQCRVSNAEIAELKQRS